MLETCLGMLQHHRTPSGPEDSRPDRSKHDNAIVDHGLCDTLLSLPDVVNSNLYLHYTIEREDWPSDGHTASTFFVHCPAAPSLRLRSMAEDRTFT